MWEKICGCCGAKFWARATYEEHAKECQVEEKQTLVERVARAICRAGICGPESHLQVEEDAHWRRFVLEAKAAVAAMGDVSARKDEKCCVESAAAKTTSSANSSEICVVDLGELQTEIFGEMPSGMLASEADETACKIMDLIRPYLRTTKRESSDVDEKTVQQDLANFVAKHSNQTEAANALGISQGNLSDMLRGFRAISVDAALVLGYAKEYRYTRLKSNEIEVEP